MNMVPIIITGQYTELATDRLAFLSCHRTGNDVWSLLQERVQFSPLANRGCHMRPRL